MFPEIKKELESTPELEEKLKNIKKEIIKEIEKQGYNAVPVGSTERGTYLPTEEDIDIDIFFYFPKEATEKELEEKGVEVGKKALKKYQPTTHYAEHPYVKAEIQKIDIDVVPCHNPETYMENTEKPKLKQETKSSVDRTPLHNKYLKQNLKEKHKPEIKLLKKYLKNIRCYGANEKTKGFSGYTTELLILKYGTFKKTLEKASEWERNHKIDIEKHGKKQFKDPLIIIDPVDPERNAASALSEEKLGRFIIKSRELLKNPTKETYKDKEKSKNLEIEGKNLILIEIPYPEETVAEIGWSQLKKLEKTLKTNLEKQEYEIYRSEHWTNEKTKAQILLEARNTKLPKYRKHMGPPFYNKKHSKKFLEKNQEKPNNIHIQGKRLYASKKRKNTKIEKAIKELFKEKKEEIPSRYREKIEKATITQDKEKIKNQKEIIKKYFRI